MIVLTSPAAQISNISTARMRVLLAAGRVKGAYKSGKFWLIPLYRGKPIIEKRKKGPAPRWSNPRKPAKIVVHVNKHAINYNNKHCTTKKEVISVKRSSGLPPAQKMSLKAINPKHQIEEINLNITPCEDDVESLSCSSRPMINQETNVYGHEVEILGGCRVVYDPKGLKCGAKVWIETFGDVTIISWN